MQRGIEVRVERKEHTPRDHLISGRFNIILSMKAEVPDNSYLIVGGLVEELEERYGELRRRIDDLVKRGFNADVIEREIVPLLKQERRREGTGFLKYEGKAAIPGSSLKGAVRSRVEYKLKPFPFGNTLRSYSCYITQNPWAASPNTNHARFWGDDVVYTRPTCRPPNVCVVCDLFGAPSLSSRVLFSDAVMERGSTTYLSDLEREAAEPGSVFNAQILIINADLLDLGLIFSGTEVLTGKNIIIGAFKYRYNPKFGTKYKGKYIGLLKFELDSYDILPEGSLPHVKGKEDLINKSREALIERFGDYIDLERGAI